MPVKPFPEPIYVTRPLLVDLEEVHQALGELWRSQWLTNNGAKHRQLEQELSGVLKVPALSLFANGTIALMAAVRSLELQGEVITTPFTFPATTHVLAWQNIRPVFCDIDENTLTIDPARIRNLITDRTSGILGVHVYGMPCNVKAIRRIADEHHLKVVYDAAHAFGTEIAGTGIGNFGDISMFSFHATKLFHTLEGGALAFPSPGRKEQIDLLRNFGIKNEEEVLLPGINGKMNEFQAAVGILNLRHLDAERKKRARIVGAYQRNLSGMPGIRIMTVPEGTVDSLQYFVIRIQEAFGASRDDVYESMKQYNVFTRKYFYPLTSDYPCYRKLPSADPVLLPMARKAAREVLCLPLYGDLAPDSVDAICEMIGSLARP